MKRDTRKTITIAEPGPSMFSSCSNSKRIYLNSACNVSMLVLMALQSK